jgi:polyisoprenoid-binding protein YceI
MKASLWSSLCALAFVAIPLPVPGLANASQEANGIEGRILILEPSVIVRCPLTVGGSFDAKTTTLGGDLAIDPQKQELDGSVAVDLRTLQTGIKLRDTHMRDNYLEVQKGPGYDQAVLTRIRLDGNAAAPIGKVGFSGTLAVHGVQREVTGTADIRRTAEGVRVQASFPIKVSEFAIASPSYLGVGVRDDISIAVTFNAMTRRTN